MTLTVAVPGDDSLCLDAKRLTGTSKVGNGVFLSLYKVGLEIALAVALAVVAGFSDNDFVVGLIVLAVDASGAIETNKEVGGCSCLDLDDDGFVRRVITVISDADHFNDSICSDLRVDEQLPGTFTTSSVPSQLPVLGRVIAHLSNLVGVERVTHHSCMIGVGSTIEAAGMGQAQVVT